VIFAVLDVSLDVNLCINCSFFTFIIIININIFVKRHRQSYRGARIKNLFLQTLTKVQNLRNTTPPPLSEGWLWPECGSVIAIGYILLAIYSESCVKIYRCQFCHVLARFSHRHYMCPSVRPSVCLSVRLSQASSRLILFMDVSLVATMYLRRFTTWTIRYLDCLLPGRFATWTVCYLDDSPPGWLANGRFAPLDVSIPRRFATSLHVSPPVWKFVICDRPTARTSLSSGGEKCSSKYYNRSVNVYIRTLKFFLT